MDNCGKIINIGMGCCEPVLGPVENYYTKTQVDRLIENIDVSGVTEEEVDEKISSACNQVYDTLTGHTSNNSIHVSSAQTAAWDAKSNFSGSYNDLADKPTIPTIWSGTEQQWSQISGGTLDNNTIYLVY